MSRFFLPFCLFLFVGKKIEVRVSTRVPEKLFGQKFEGMRIFYDNAKLVRESDIILLCTPKHKSRTVFKSIQPQVKELFKKGIVSKIEVKRKSFLSQPFWLVFSLDSNLWKEKILHFCDWQHAPREAWPDDWARIRHLNRVPSQVGKDKKISDSVVKHSPICGY